MYKMDIERRDKQLKLVHALQQFTKIAGRKIHLHQVTSSLLFINVLVFLFSLIACILALKDILRFTTRTEKLTKCYEPLQKLRVRLGSCKTGLSPPVIYN